MSFFYLLQAEKVKLMTVIMLKESEKANHTRPKWWMKSASAERVFNLFHFVYSPPQNCHSKLGQNLCPAHLQTRNLAKT